MILNKSLDECQTTTFEIPFLVKIETCPLIRRQNKFSQDRPFATNVSLLLLKNSRIIMLTIVHISRLPILSIQSSQNLKKKKDLQFTSLVLQKQILTSILFVRFVSIVWVNIRNRNLHEHRMISFHRKIDRSMDWQRSAQVHRFSVDYAVWQQIYLPLARWKMPSFNWIHKFIQFNLVFLITSNTW